MKAKASLFFFLSLLATSAFAQISPPGLGRAHAAGWLALGVRQDLDSLETWESMTYLGMGRKSNPTDHNPLQKPAILVLNQEFYYRFHLHWQSSFAVSYRRQDEYIDQPPFDHADPAKQQEFRVYSRLSYVAENSRFKFVPTFRQEFRKFYTPSLGKPSENFQLRSRVRLQLKVNLDEAKVHRLIFSSEQLFAASRLYAPARWTGLHYKESRFVGYYSVAPKSLPLIFDLGYMLDRLGTSSPAYVHYVALDVIWKNPFGNRFSRQREEVDNLE